ncbi:MAG: hypothetical protein OJF52_000994 [Nitrospira sp.]|nr:MAG: hypothetical protein OJF52_000994 [Nitrospira sp.]
MTIHVFKRHYLIHRWTSLVCTAFLLLLCLTGLPLIFWDEIGHWLGVCRSPLLGKKLFVRRCGITWLTRLTQ